MPLPDLIEIVPVAKPVRAEVTVPGSKSITNRALVLAALAAGETTLEGALWSEDTQVMADSLRRLGFRVEVSPDPQEICNRTIKVAGRRGAIPSAGTPEQPLELFVGNAGTAARFLTALVCLGRGVYRLSGVPRMHERPQAALFQALRKLGYRLEAANDRLPVIIHGAGPQAGDCEVSISESSQFASALLLCAQTGGWRVKVVGENAEESPYVAMTRKLRRAFSKHGSGFRLEPDASSGSYFWAAGWLNPLTALKMAGCPKVGSLADGSPVKTKRFVERRTSAVTVSHWPTSGWQIDADFPRYLPLPRRLSRSAHLGDSILTAMILAPFASATVSFTDLGRLRLQECERVVAMRTELARCGAEVLEQGDALHISPSPLHGAEIETYQDHRIAMCFAILGLKVAGLRIKNPACVKKTFPNFFQKLATPPPHGLGATIRSASTGRILKHDELFAA